MKLELPKKEIGSMIQTKRVSQGLSQGKLAKKLQCNTQLISNIERGVCTPKNELFKEIIIELNFTPHEKSQIVSMLHRSLDNFLKKEVLL